MQPRHSYRPCAADKACLNQAAIDESLPCLPIYLAACEKLLVLPGLTYGTRLWVRLQQLNLSLVFLLLLWSGFAMPWGSTLAIDSA